MYCLIQGYFIDKFVACWYFSKDLKPRTRLTCCAVKFRLSFLVVVEATLDSRLLRVNSC